MSFVHSRINRANFNRIEHFISMDTTSRSLQHANNKSNQNDSWLEQANPGAKGNSTPAACIKRAHSSHYVPMLFTCGLSLWIQTLSRTEKVSSTLMLTELKHGAWPCQKARMLLLDHGWYEARTSLGFDIDNHIVQFLRLEIHNKFVRSSHASTHNIWILLSRTWNLFRVPAKTVCTIIHDLGTILGDPWCHTFHPYTQRFKLITQTTRLRQWKTKLLIRLKFTNAITRVMLNNL